MFNVIKSYFYFMRNFNRVMRDVKSKYTHEFDDSIEYFDYIHEEINLGLDKKLAAAEYYKIDNKLYTNIIDHLLLLKHKLNFLLVHKQRYLKYMNETLDKHKEISNDLFLGINSTAKNILDSEVLKTTSTSYLNLNWEYQEKFNIVENKIIPNFTSISPQEYTKNIENDGKIRITFKERIFASRMDLSFSKNLQDEIIVGFKTVKNGNMEYTTEAIKLSKFKQIALRFENCIELVIFSNSNFVKYLTNITVYGGNTFVDRADCFGVLNLGPSQYTELMFETKQNMDFYKISSSDLKNADNYFLHSDLENSKYTTKIESNILNKIDFKDTDKIIVRFSTEEPIIDNIKAYGKIKEVVVNGD